MTQKIAEVLMALECGGYILTYLPCKGEKDFHKKMKKKNKDGVFDFGHFTVDYDSVIKSFVKFHEAH